MHIWRILCRPRIAAVHRMRHCSAAASPFVAQTGEEPHPLFQVEVPLHDQKHYGPEPLAIRMVFQDTAPQTSAAEGVPTVVMMHGSPGASGSGWGIQLTLLSGSHKDFKYVVPLLVEKGIRCIGINWPGMGYSQFDQRLRSCNEERNALVHSLLGRLGLERSGRLLFLGHSRGAENALQLAALCPRSLGCVLLNSPGLRVHKGIRPLWQLHAVHALWQLHPALLQPLLAPLYKNMYEWIGLRVADGYVAGRCLATMMTFSFGELAQSVAQLNQRPHARAVVASSGRDFLLETEISHEFANEFAECRNLSTSTLGEEDQIIADTEATIREGAKNVWVHFTQEGHFLQKFRAKFVATCVGELFQQSERIAQKESANL